MASTGRDSRGWWADGMENAEALTQSGWLYYSLRLFLWLVTGLQVSFKELIHLPTDNGVIYDIWDTTLMTTSVAHWEWLQPMLVWVRVLRSGPTSAPSFCFWCESLCFQDSQGSSQLSRDRLLKSPFINNTAALIPSQKGGAQPVPHWEENWCPKQPPRLEKLQVSGFWGLWSTGRVSSWNALKRKWSCILKMAGYYSELVTLHFFNTSLLY